MCRLVPQKGGYTWQIAYLNARTASCEQIYLVKTRWLLILGLREYTMRRFSLLIVVKDSIYSNQFQLLLNKLVQ